MAMEAHVTGEDDESNGPDGAHCPVALELLFDRPIISHKKGEAKASPFLFKERWT
jgi:hypothetical protein